jgi:hypothetical protein
MSAAYWLNNAWLLASLPSALAFQRATTRVRATQTALLLDMVHENRDTEFGRRHRFASIQTTCAYQERVPLATYDDFAHAVERIAAGETNVLTRTPVTLLEPTSGSSGGEKLIPYTRELHRQFQRAIRPWIANLLRQRPGLRGGRAYWSISPAFGPRRASSGRIPIGFDDDTAYLGVFERFAAARLLAVPCSVARHSDLGAFRYDTLFHLLQADDLTLVSLWNPTFLTALLRPLEYWFDCLVHDIRCRNRARADQVARILRNGGSRAEQLRALWPRLRLISCWTDAAAASYVPELRTLFPHVEIQPKGLLATEGFVSLPFFDVPGAALAVRSHFFEFQETSGTTACRLAHEVERGGRYRVVITTAGGLYRYQLRDEVEVVGFLHQCPLLRFCGKADLVSDLVGEKLAEPFVRAVLEQIWRSRAVVPRFALLVPIRGTPPRYRLIAEGIEPMADFQDQVQRALEANPHYRYACGIGQLAPVEIHLLHGEDGWHLYERGCLARGQMLGNIKPVTLDPRSGWDEVFQATDATSAQR